MVVLLSVQCGFVSVGGVDPFSSANLLTHRHYIYSLATGSHKGPALKMYSLNANVSKKKTKQININ